MTDIKPCPACGSEVLEIFHKLESGPYVRCLACGYFNLVDAWQTGAERVGALESRFITRVRFLEMEIERLTAENTQTKAALEFYADRNNWSNPCEVTIDCGGDNLFLISAQGWKFAQEALKGDEK